MTKEALTFTKPKGKVKNYDLSAAYWQDNPVKALKGYLDVAGEDKVERLVGWAIAVEWVCRNNPILAKQLGAQKSIPFPYQDPEAATVAGMMYDKARAVGRDPIAVVIAVENETLNIEIRKANPFDVDARFYTGEWPSESDLEGVSIEPLTEPSRNPS